MAHPLFTPEIREMLGENDIAGMKSVSESLHPATVAESLAEAFSVEDVWRFLSVTDIRTQATILEYLPIEAQVSLVEGAGKQAMAKLIEQMSHDDRVSLLRRVRPRVAEELLRLVDEADRRDIASLTQYQERSAGALMTTDYAWVPNNITVGEAFDRLRLQAPNSETIYYVFVLDDQRKLLGVVTLRELVLAPRHTVIATLMERDVVTVKPSEDQEQLAQIMARYDLLAIPVVDDLGRLIGIVTHDDVIDVVVRQATEDVQHMGGVLAMTEDYLKAPFFSVWRKRVIWLACLFVAELLTFWVLASFHKSIEKVVVLSFFIPLCISTGGNSGSQAATLITRAMALGQVKISQWLSILRHEMLMGLVLGLSLGAIGFVRASFVPSNMLHDEIEWWRLSLIIAQSVMVICTWGTMIGAMLPVLFKRFGFDPAFASSPFVATFVDVTGITIYFTIASYWIPSLKGSS